HALAARLGGDDTAYEEGQVSLNPLPHIRREPFGTVLVPLLSYFASGWMLGWASAPYDPHWQERYPHRAAWMALAGPAANFSLVILSGILIHLGIFAGIFEAPRAASFAHIAAGTSTGLPETAAVFLSILFSLNLLLAIFNLLPIPPLDGNSAVGIFLSEENALRFAELSRSPSFSLIGLLIAWQIFDHVFSPVFVFALNMLYFGAGYA
ncbi:MAG TPA: site-2 protease family protein, partial [Oligoflexia bacterium]|nr:site-2 protease family protein [Oligoflexia bacterium]